MLGKTDRRFLGGAFAVLLVMTSCTGDGDDDAGGSDDGTTTTPDESRGHPVPADDDVVVGTLDSGLTYYVRENDDPGGRAQLRLVVQAGSVNETESQSGGAHYLEHMLFNGTAEYPANELTDVLADFGAQLGPDINAYTSYDETVYMLEAETDDGDDELEVGIDVLAQWATAAVIDPEEVDAERGVVLSERRLHTEAADGRLEAAFLEVLTAGSAYEDHETIGRLEILEEISADEIRSFYETWYQPERMAVVVVGDIDSDDVVEMIEDTFDGAFDGRGDEAVEEVEPQRTAPSTDPTIRADEDDELDRAYLRLSLPTDPLDLGTVEGREQALQREVAARLLANRLQNDTLRGDVPLLTADVENHSGQLLLLDALTVSVDADTADLDGAVTGGLEAVERARREGFDASELDRVVAELTSELEDLEQQDKQDVYFAGQYVDHFLGYGSMPSVADGIELDLDALDALTVDGINSWLASLPAPSAFLAGPDLSALGSDPAAGLAERAAAVAEAELEPREPEPPVPDELMDRPTGGEIVDATTTEVQTTYLLGNGVTVIAAPEENLNSVYVEVYSPGGSSVLPDADVVSAQLMPGIASRSDLGALERLQVDAYLAETSVGAEPVIDEFSEGVQGGALPDDLEVLLQLTRLYLTDVRPTEGAARLEVGEMRTQAAHPDRDADVASAVALGDAYYSGSARHRFIPSLDELESFDLERGEQLYRERFADASDLTVVIVGTYDADELEDLVADYFGTLPSNGETEQWVDRVPPFPAGVTTRRVEAGSGDQGSVQLVWWTPADRIPPGAMDPTTYVTADLLRTILTTRLVDSLREDLGATYSPTVDIGTVPIPRSAVESYIRIDGDPDDVDAVTAETLSVIADLATDGPTDAELDQAREQLRRDYELSSGYDRAQAVLEWLGMDGVEDDFGLAFFYFGRTELLDVTGADDVRDLASRALPADNRIEVVQVPAASTP